MTDPIKAPETQRHGPTLVACLATIKLTTLATADIIGTVSGEIRNGKRFSIADAKALDIAAGRLFTSLARTIAALEAITEGLPVDADGAPVMAGDALVSKDGDTAKASLCLTVKRNAGADEWVRSDDAIDTAKAVK